jgi:hypothetical protein
MLKAGGAIFGLAPARSKGRSCGDPTLFEDAGELCELWLAVTPGGNMLEYMGDLSVLS